VGAGVALGGLLVVVVLLAAPPAGLAGSAPFAQVLAFRAAVGLGLLVLAGLVVAVGPLRRRRVGRALAAVLLVGALAQLGVLAARGWTGSGPDARARSDAAGRDVVVLSFNTAGVVTPDELARLVRGTGADVVALPETTRGTADALAALLETAGNPVQVHAQRTGEGTAAATTLLVSRDLGEHTVTGTLPTRLASFRVEPVGGDDGSPFTSLVAAHPRAPLSGAAMPGWRSETALLRDACRSTPGAVVAGDLNATLDHPGLAGLAPCVDAADAVGAAALGTWPASAPRWLAAPIDHVLVDSRAWEVLSFDVLAPVGDSDHRPVVAHLRTRG
jgi:endonuclease/exonuclease/phosphatase (EEP) superfamily protein YafD